MLNRRKVIAYRRNVVRKRKPNGARKSQVIRVDFRKTTPPQGPPETRAAFAAMNERFAVVTGGKHGGRVVDLSMPWAPHFLNKERFSTLLQNKRVSTNSRTAPISKVWLQMEDRREITDLVFEPTGSPHHVPDGAHNMWRGFAVEPMEGDSHKPLLHHIRINFTRPSGLGLLQQPAVRVLTPCTD